MSDSTSFTDLIAVALVSGLVSSAVTAFVVPPFQHYFWTRQRHAEICLALIQELTNLANKFWENYRFTWRQPINTLRKEHLIAVLEFNFAWSALGDQIKCLFNARSWESCLPLFDMMQARLTNRDDAEVDSAPLEKTEFSRTKERALRALYTELALTGEQSLKRRLRRFANRWLIIWPK